MTNTMWSSFSVCFEEDLESVFFKAIAEGNISIIDICLELNLVNQFANNSAFRNASQNGQIAIVDRFLQDGCVDPSADNNSAIRYASENGHIAVVDRLLQDGRVDPSAVNNFAICFASQNGHIAVVNRLLQDRRMATGSI